MHDIVIRGGTIIDGSGRAAFAGDVTIGAVGLPRSVAKLDRPGARSTPGASW
jgi:N-acyl-D-amino-acid deacylase